MALYRGKIRWTIPGAGTALSVLHFSGAETQLDGQLEADDVSTRIHSFLTPIINVLPNVVKVQALSEVEEINPSTGDLIGFWNTPAKAERAGTAAATAGWAAAAGAVISWSTAGVRNGRRVRGRTFVVPLSNECWDVDGTIKSVPLGSLTTGAQALTTGTDVTRFNIWSRPSAPGASDGAAFPVSGFRIPDMSAILRSRRA
jgi:hypothetical protein